MLAFILTFILPRFTIFGYRMGVHLGGSMEPAIQSGSLTLQRKVDPDTLTIGDVINFRRLGLDRRITHRIVDIQSRNGHLSFITKGDANSTADSEEVTSESEKIYTNVVDVPYFGYVFLVSGPFTAVLLLLGLIGLGLHATGRRRLRLQPAGVRRKQSIGNQLLMGWLSGTTVAFILVVMSASLAGSLHWSLVLVGLLFMAVNLPLAWFFRERVISAVSQVERRL